MEKIEEGSRRRKSPMWEAYEWVETAVVTIGVMLTIFSLLVRPALVNGVSMLPTLRDGEQLALWQVGYHDPDYGDIVVVDTPQLEEKVIVKRVIGKAGDTIDINFQTGEVRRNGEVLEEPYIKEPTALYEGVDFPVQVPEGCLFVMGDNRNNSKDSRNPEIGMVDTRRVMGKVVFRLLPLNKIGPVE